MSALPFPEPFKAGVLRLLWEFSGKDKRMDRILTSWLDHRHYLPEREAEEIIPDFAETEVRIRQYPTGPWSTPLQDLVVLAKAGQAFGSRRILELGSYRGHTARFLAENTPETTTIHAVDIDERHGAAYRGHPIESRIVRVTGAASTELFAPEEKFDFIFVDADHRLDHVLHDSEVAFNLLAENGVIFWHDYLDTSGYFDGNSLVPEALNILQKKIPIVGIKGSWLAMYSTIPGWETSKATQSSPGSIRETVWDQTGMRG